MHLPALTDLSTRARAVVLACLVAVTVVLLAIAGAWQSGSGTAAPSPSPSATRTTSAVPAGAATVLAPLPLDAGTAPTTAGLAAALGPLLADPVLGPRVGAQVVDLGSGAVLLSSASSRAQIAASTVKVLTAAAALSRLGPDHRFTTWVTAGSRPGEIVLVGGGDPGLGVTAADTVAPGGTLTELAVATAAAARAAGLANVSLRYDNRLFVGSPVAPSWPPGYVAGGVVAPVSALAVEREEATVVLDPALRAANAFAAALTAAGVSVIAPPTPVATDSPLPVMPSASPTPASASAAATPAAGSALASVRSAPLSGLVEHMLTVSDNDAAETLARQVAIASGSPGSEANGTAAVTAALSALGLDTAGLSLADGSGLSRDTVVPPALLTATLVDAADTPALASLPTAMAVAAFTGTLSDRFAVGPDVAAAGLLRAKTGTLTGVSGLTGVVPTASGRLVAFAVLADAVPTTGIDKARDALDRIAATLAACGC